MRSTKLVLKRFVMGRPGDEGPFLDVEGRSPGLLSFILNLIGVDPTVSFRCYADRVEVIEASLRGREKVVVPIGKISGILGGHSRSVGSLAAAGICATFGSLGMMAGLVLPGDTGAVLVGAVGWYVIGLVALVAFFLSRSMVLAVQNGGDRSYGLRFGQGVIAGVDVNPAKVQEALELLNAATNAGTRIEPTSVSGARAA